MTYTEAVNRMVEIAAELARIADKPSALTAADEQQWTELVEELAAVDAHRKLLEVQTQAERQGQGPGVEWHRENGDPPVTRAPPASRPGQCRAGRFRPPGGPR